MKFRTALIIGLGVVASGCTRNKQDAILKANEGDKTIKADVDAAIADYDEASKIDPANQQIWYKLAEAYKKKPDWAKAAESYAGAIKADTDAHQGKPTFAVYYAGLGWAKENQAKKPPAGAAAQPGGGVQIDYKEAEAPDLKCIELDPNFADCYFNLGNVYLWMDNEQKSLEYYTKAIQHDPTQMKYYGPLADLYARLNFMKEEEQVLKEEQAFEPANPDPDSSKFISVNRQRYGQILKDRGDVKGAVQQFEIARDKAPGDSPQAVTILYALGNAYADLDPPEKQKALENLKAFYQRACKGPKAALYKLECGTIQSRVSQLGGTLQ